MPGFEDPYKSEGTIQLKIGKLSQFAQGELNSLRLSDAIYVQGLPWKIYARNQENDLKQKVLGYYLKCDTENKDPAWSCTCSAKLKVLAQKEGKEDYVRKFNQSRVFNATNKICWGYDDMTFEALKNPKYGLYDEVTDSIILQVEIAADAPHGVKNMPDDVYTEYTMRSEHSLFVELMDGFNASNSQYNTSNLAIEGKLWSFTYSPFDKTLQLAMFMHESDASKMIAECIFWYWGDKEIAILQKSVHTFGESMVNNADTGMKSSKISVPTNGATPVNKKFNIVIRLLDVRTPPPTDNNSLESYYGNCEGIETVTLNILGITNKASFVVPKNDLIRASPVFQRMLTNPMTEKTTGKVDIEDTNPEEFGDFLKAISPKQEHPNPSNVFALLKLADRYDIQSLRDRCELHLLNCVEIPLIHLLSCANFYRLEKLKINLRVSFHGTGLVKLLPYLGLLNEFTQMG